jgi:hypothetical protein
MSQLSLVWAQRRGGRRLEYTGCAATRGLDDGGTPPPAPAAPLDGRPRGPQAAARLRDDRGAAGGKLGSAGREKREKAGSVGPRRRHAQKPGAATGKQAARLVRPPAGAGAPSALSTSACRQARSKARPTPHTHARTQREGRRPRPHRSSLAPRSERAAARRSQNEQDTRARGAGAWRARAFGRARTRAKGGQAARPRAAAAGPRRPSAPSARANRSLALTFACEHCPTPT